MRFEIVARIGNERQRCVGIGVQLIQNANQMIDAPLNCTSAAAPMRSFDCYAWVRHRSPAEFRGCVRGMVVEVLAERVFFCGASNGGLPRRASKSGVPDADLHGTIDF